MLPASARNFKKKIFSNGLRASQLEYDKIGIILEKNFFGLLWSIDTYIRGNIRDIILKVMLVITCMEVYCEKYWL